MNEHDYNEPCGYIEIGQVKCPNCKEVGGIDSDHQGNYYFCKCGYEGLIKNDVFGENNMTLQWRTVHGS